MSIKQYYKPSLLLKPEHERPLKQIALDRGVSVQDLLRDMAVALIEAGSTTYPQRPTPIPVPPRDISIHERGLISMDPSQLRELRESLRQALALLDGVLDGQTVADQIGAIERAIETGEDLGSSGPDSSSDRVKKPKAR